MPGFQPLDKCRISGSRNLVSVLHLGSQELTGVFPTSGEAVTAGPLELVWCPDSGLLQLGHTFDLAEMYGENYGYRSGLNRSMAQHLSDKISGLERAAELRPGDAVLDIGSNDGTSLKAYQTSALKKVGFDPTGEKFRRYYPADVLLIPTFFSAHDYFRCHGNPAKIVTSIAMFYDLDDPIDFARNVSSVLAEDGIWHFEQSYMPSMLRMNAYDTICHEHLEYYSLHAVQKILEAAALRIVDVQLNNINGGSFAVTAAHKRSKVKSDQGAIEQLLDQEDRMGLSTQKPFGEFKDRVLRHKTDLTRLLKSLAADGSKVLGYGASTKGNVILQFCGFGPSEVTAIAEINEDKFGKVTPGSHIPIISEGAAKAMRPDYFLMLPWHFKEGILHREREWRATGGKFIVPLPEIEIV